MLHGKRRDGKSTTDEIRCDYFYLKALIVTAPDTAMSKDEVLKFRRRDIDFEAGEINIRAMNTKNQTRRTIGTTSQAALPSQKGRCAADKACTVVKAL